MSSQEMERLEPIIAEDRESRPPCCVSTHRSHVVDICISPTFLDHREATLFGISQIPIDSFSKPPGGSRMAMQTRIVMIRHQLPPTRGCAMKFTRRHDLDPHTRIEIVKHVWIHQGIYRKMTQIAQEYHISRTCLYQLSCTAK